MSRPLFDDFVDRTVSTDTWEIITRQSGAGVRTTPAASCVELIFPAHATMSSPAGCAEIASHQPCHYGRYAVRMMAGRCEPQAETVSSFFTYWHGDDPKGNNHEIDIEILGSEPETIYLTVWTHADHDTGLQRRITRVIDLRTGTYKQSTLDGEGFLQRENPLAPPAFPITGRYDFTAPDFDAAARFYTYSFDWQPDRVCYTIEIDGQRHVLWNLNDARVIPSHPSSARANLWWTNVHWDRPESALPPANTVIHRLDWIRYQPA